MSTAHVIQTVIEIIVAIILLVGLIYEPVLAQWERRQGEKMLKELKKRKMYRK